MLSKIRGVPADQFVQVLEDHGAVELAAAELTSRSTVKRARAAQVLGLARAGHAVPLLVEALGDEAVEVRRRRAYALGLIAWRRVSVLGDRRARRAAATAAEALQSMGVGISDVLRDGMADANARTRMVAAHLSAERHVARGLPEGPGTVGPRPRPHGSRAPPPSGGSVAARTSTSSCATPRDGAARAPPRLCGRVGEASVRPARCR